MQYDMQHSMQHDLQQQQHHYAPAPYLNGRIKSENGSDRGLSPHISDYSSRYPSQPTQQMQPYPSMSNSLSNDLRYPSPTQMQVPTPLLNGYNPTPAPDHTYQPHVQQDQQAQSTADGRTTSADTGPPKAFACSSCGKGFARRSDLARHGEAQLVQLQTPPMLTRASRAHSQRHSSTRVRLAELRQAIHSEVGLDGAPARSHWRKAPHVRALWKGKLIDGMSTSRANMHCSPSAIPVRSRDTGGYIPANDRTSVLMPIVKRRLRDAPR